MLSRAADEPAKKPKPETLVAQFYKTLSEEQKKIMAFSFDDPLRLEVNNDWHITKAVIGRTFSKDQQAMIREIFMGLHSEQYAKKVLADVLAPFRKVDVDECMKLVEAQFDKLHFAYYQNMDIGNDRLWDVWQIEGPAMVLPRQAARAYLGQHSQDGVSTFHDGRPVKTTKDWPARRQAMSNRKRTGPHLGNSRIARAPVPIYSRPL